MGRIGSGGIFGETGGYGDGARGSSDRGPGVRGQSQSGAGVYGETASGFAGIFGYNHGSTAGVWGLGSSGPGVLGTSSSGDGVYGEGATGFAAIYGAGRGGWAGYFAGPVFIDGAVTVTGAKTDYIAEIARNASGNYLHTGDVVVIAGATTPVVGDIPTPLVTTTSNANATGVFGVVAASLPISKTTTSVGEVDRSLVNASAWSTAAETVQPDEVLTVVTQGAFKAISVDASFGAVAPGDLLVTSPHASYAMKATSPSPGSIVGKALGSISSGVGSIPVLVTLQ